MKIHIAVQYSSYGLIHFILHQLKNCYDLMTNISFFLKKLNTQDETKTRLGSVKYQKWKDLHKNL